MKEYQIFAALKAEISAPFVWLTSPGVPSRSIAKLKNPSNKKSIYCEVLIVDENFRANYNEAKHTNKIAQAEEAAVINGWYRQRLGIEKNEKAQLEVTLPGWQPLPLLQIQAGLSHPDNAVRIACDLAVVSVALGAIGLVLGVVAICA
ncbi:hypothetical protein [Arhodomonas sp. AD133]|uniref:hypothetical protein n=1 Tax=Arhodomonas sp. AD133 TaxID=3415009 RepID=UPI003EB9D235